MKEQVAITLAGVMLLTAGCENANKKAPFHTVAYGMRSATLEKEPAKDISEKNMHNQWQGRSNPSLYDGGFFIRGDFLYWRADESGLEYAYHANRDGTASKITGRILNPDVSWDPGVRVGVGYTFSSQDYWDVMALWTHFQTHQSDSKSASVDTASAGAVGESLVPWWGATILGAAASSASAHWRLTYNTYDLDLGRNYFIARTVSVHPFVGVRGATIHQNYHAKYRALALPDTFTPTAFKASSSFWGVGAHLGTSLQWRCTPSFAFLGNVGGSLLYSHFSIHERYKALITTGGAPSSTTLPATIKDRFTKGTLNLEAMLGFQWERFFYNNRYRLSIVMGYEWSEWFSQNQLIKMDVNTDGNNVIADTFERASGDLTLQGATLQVGWDF